MQRATITGILVLCVAAAGCEESSADSVRADIAAGWGAAGLSVSEFAAREEKLAGGACWQGKVAGVDTVLCQYKDAGEAGKAQKAGLAFVGETTGVALNAGVWLLAMRDGDKADPSGKAINRAATIFLDKVPRPPADKPEPPAGGDKDEAGK